MSASIIKAGLARAFGDDAPKVVLAEGVGLATAVGVEDDSVYLKALRAWYHFRALPQMLLQATKEA